MKVFSLFSGVGGFDKAMTELGHEIVGACEIDSHARSVYARQFPGVFIYEDATKVQPSELSGFDILCAGFPCQAFSVAGKRLGFSDTRGTLFFEIARIAREKRPSYLFLENVKGLLYHNKGGTFRTILNTLDELGYDAEWQCFNSKYFVPQNRDRLFIVGHAREKSTRKIFPLGDFGRETDSKKLVQIANIDQKGHNSIWGRVYDPKGLAPNLNANGGGMGAKTGLIGVLNDRGTLRETEISTCIDANYWKGCDNHAQRTMIYMSQKNSNMKQRVQDRKETWTLTNNGNDFGLLENMRIRKLMPVECERLQAFPDGWTDGLSDTQRYRCMGNAVTVSVVKFIASHFWLPPKDSSNS